MKYSCYQCFLYRNSYNLFYNKENNTQKKYLLESCSILILFYIFNTATIIFIKIINIMSIFRTLFERKTLEQHNLETILITKQLSTSTFRLTTFPNHL